MNFGRKLKNKLGISETHKQNYLTFPNFLRPVRQQMESDEFLDKDWFNGYQNRNNGERYVTNENDVLNDNIDDDHIAEIISGEAEILKKHNIIG